MAEHDDENDPDRAAIMARRRRFIAVALGGLTGCTPGKPGPTPTSISASGTDGSTTRVESSESESGDESGSGGESGSGTETGPRPCLKFDLPPEHESESESDSGTESGGPRPCLTPIGFR